ncbi:MAG: hypothetical protein ACK53X_05835 [Holosporales bacterium]
MVAGWAAVSTVATTLTVFKLNRTKTILICGFFILHGRSDV